MPRISVSLPEELTTRLEPVKNRINISQVCREALERRVTALELATGLHGAELDMEGLIARLREERALVEGKFEALGRDSAAVWLDTASYLEFKSVAGNGASPNMARYKLPRSAFRLMKRDMEEAEASYDGAQAVAYKTAWLDSVNAIWAEVAHRVEETNGTEPAEATE